MERFDAEVSGAVIEGNTLKGIAHVFGRRTMRGGKWVEMSQAAFERSLADPATDVRSFFNHDTSMLLGRQKAGTLRVSIEDGQMPFEVDLPDTSYARDLRVLVERGDLDGASFGVNPSQIERFTAPDGKPGIRFSELGEFLDISPVALPAFDGTSLQLHSESYSEPMLASQLVMARHRVRMEVRS